MAGCAKTFASWHGRALDFLCMPPPLSPSFLFFFLFSLSRVSLPGRCWNSVVYRHLPSFFSSLRRLHQLPQLLIITPCREVERWPLRPSRHFASRVVASRSFRRIIQIVTQKIPNMIRQTATEHLLTRRQRTQTRKVPTEALVDLPVRAVCIC